MTVDIYTRISTMGDRNAHDLQSPDAQAEAARRYIGFLRTQT